MQVAARDPVGTSRSRPSLYSWTWLTRLGLYSKSQRNSKLIATIQPIMTPLRIMSEEAGWCSISGLDVLVELKVSRRSQRRSRSYLFPFWQFVGVHIWTGHTVDAALREKVRMIVRQKMGL